MSSFATTGRRLGPVLALALLAAGGAPAAETLAADKPAGGTPPTRMVSLTVYGADPCPASSDGEIVVCAREPESERFRIPKRFRRAPPDDGGGRSWTDRVAGVEEASRPQRPNSCSAVGASGQTGCTQAMLRQWFADRREKKAEATEVP